MDISTLFFFWVLIALSFSGGYFIGSGKSPKEIKEQIQKKLQQITESSGGINRPTNEQVNAWQDKEKYEADEEFKKEFLTAHPDFQKVLDEYERQNK